MVTVSGNPNHQYPAYIQDMQPNKGPVSVFVEVLGERWVHNFNLISVHVFDLSLISL